MIVTVTVAVVISVAAGCYLPAAVDIIQPIIVEKGQGKGSATDNNNM